MNEKKPFRPLWEKGQKGLGKLSDTVYGSKSGFVKGNEDIGLFSDPFHYIVG